MATASAKDAHCSSDASMWHRNVQVGQRWTTDMCGIDAVAGAARLHVVLAPGNPGSARFYEPFLRLLHAALGGTANVSAYSHLGHDVESPHVKELWSIEQQIEHTGALLSEHVLLPGRPPVVLIGHSLGSYLLLHAIDVLRKEQAYDERLLTKVVCMFPFLEADFTLGRVRRLSWTSRFYSAIGAAASMLSCLPTWATARIFKALAKDNLGDHAVNTCCKLLSGPTLQQYFFLTSRYVLRRPFNWDLLTNLGDKVVLYCCPEDTWMPETLFKFIASTYPGVQLRWDKDQIHAFIVSMPRCAAAAQLVAREAKRASSGTEDAPAAKRRRLTPGTPLQTASSRNNLVKLNGTKPGPALRADTSAERNTPHKRAYRMRSSKATTPQS